MRSESESASHSSPPQLKGVYYFVNLSTVTVCLPVYTVTHTHTHTHTHNTKNTGKYMSRNDKKSTLSREHSIAVLSHEKHAHSLQ